MSLHKFTLSSLVTKRHTAGGQRVLASSEKISHLKGMALSIIDLKKGGVREPHWHPNASELTYCMEGKALITIFAPGNAKHTFTLEKGEVVFFPQGFIHHIENIYDGPSRFLLCYDHDNPTDLNLSSSLRSMPPHVVSSTFGMKKGAFTPLYESQEEAFISLKKDRHEKKMGSIPNMYKMSLERIHPQLQGEGGYAKVGNIHSFKSLERLALFSLVIEPHGIREPHWHPNATELNYVLEGKARLVIVSPHGERDEFIVEKNEGSIIPKGYFHSIENMDTVPMHMAVYFNSNEPSDIGLSGAMSAFSDDVLASIFLQEESFFAKIPKIYEDKLVVRRKE